MFIGCVPGLYEEASRKIWVNEMWNQIIRSASTRR